MDPRGPAVNSRRGRRYNLGTRHLNTPRGWVWIAGWASWLLLLLLAAGGAASRPGGLWLGMPTPGATALAVAVTVALAAFDRARAGALCIGVLPLAVLLLIGVP